MYETLVASPLIIGSFSDEDGIVLATPSPPDIRILNTRQRSLQPLIRARKAHSCLRATMLRFLLRVELPHQQEVMRKVTWCTMHMKPDACSKLDDCNKLDGCNEFVNRNKLVGLNNYKCQDLINTFSSISVASETSAPQPVLTKDQIVGIIVASILGGALVVGLLVLLICCRRQRNKRSRESDLIPFQLEPNHVIETKKHKYKSFKEPTGRIPGGTRNGIAARIPPRIPPRVDASSPNMFSRRSVRPDTIGLAVSPDQNVSVEKKQRRPSKLLPEKPTLTLKVPKHTGYQNNGFSFNQSIIQPSVISRQSTATQFEEDYDESAHTAVAADDYWTAKPTNQVLGAKTGSWQTIRKVDPEHNTIALAWRPGQNPNSTTTNPDYYIRPLSVGGRKIGSFPQLRAQDTNTRPHDPQQLFVAEEPRGIAMSSPLYSNSGSAKSAEESGSNNVNNAFTREKNLSYQPGPDDHQDSVSQKQPRVAATELTLSPVVESPASGRSPVSYPKIPPPGGPRILSQATIRLVPPPAQPDFTKALGAGKPWRQAEIAAQVERERSILQRSQNQAQAQAQAVLQNPRQRLGHQRQRSVEVREAAEPSPAVFAFPQPPVPALIPGHSQISPPPAIPSPYISRSASRSSLVPAPLLPSRSQLQRGAKSPPSPSQTGLRTSTESPPEKPNPGPLLRSTSQLNREGWKQSPSQAPNEPNQQRYPIPQEHPSTNPSPPRPVPAPFIRAHITHGLPPLQTSLQPQPEAPNEPVLVPVPQSTTPTTTTSPFYPLALSHQGQDGRSSIPLRPIPEPLTSHPSLIFTRSSSETSTSTSSSSLLQKRLGASRASALTPSLTLRSEEDHRNQIAKWRVLKREEIDNAKSDGWKPMLGREAGDETATGTGTGMFLNPSPRGGWEFERIELPVTPGWVPKLTPTRRGDELFLNVQ
ncbi:uncharacterized protein L3040_001661 [Drepanopeziza brunnea f. sp. 'multigermtubi']|uniref:uncharacterized protein n=1 Tax=Drepanopeziza brunnea f. sp. 'multigermtubi' TaxID=698441 RepID=UPI0023A3CC21|nr:hypothetical protein L3040_001661 [Drepanopeziza brunnea f. sp. 'multigermtubi']